MFSVKINSKETIETDHWSQVRRQEIRVPAALGVATGLMWRVSGLSSQRGGDERRRQQAPA